MPSASQLQRPTPSGKVSTSASFGLRKQPLPAEMNMAKPRLGLPMLCPQHHRTLRGTWLEVVLATGPEEKGALSLSWTLGSVRAPEGHDWDEGESRKSGQSRGKEDEALVCGRSPTTGRLGCSWPRRKILLWEPLPRGGSAALGWGGGGLRGSPQRKSCRALEECYCSSHPHIDSHPPPPPHCCAISSRDAKNQISHPDRSPRN